MNAHVEKSGWLKNGLGVFQILVGLSAMVGGWGLLADPSGAALGMSTVWLEGTPFGNFLIPGIFLFTVNGLGTLAGGIATLKRYRYAGEIAMLLGGIMIIWIVIQVGLIGYMNFLQPLYFVIGLLEMTGGFLLRRKRSVISSHLPLFR